MLSSKLYLLLLAGLILALMPAGTVIAEESSGFYVKYLFTMDITSTANFSMHMEVTILYRADVVSQDTLRVTVKIEKIVVSIMNNNTTTTTTITHGTSEAPSEQFEYSMEVSIDDYFLHSISGGDALGAASALTGFNLGMFMMYYNITYDGMGTYNGLPVYMYGVSMDTYIEQTRFRGTGKTYLHVATLQPLYMFFEMDFTGTQASGKLVYELEALDTNLPAQAESLVEDLGRAQLIAGGLPGADMVVKGEKGSSNISVTNNGDQPGYVIILYKDRQLSLSAAPNKLINAYRVVAVKPGETKIIDLGFTLDKDISVAAEPVKPGISWEPIILLAVIAIVAGTAALVIRRSVNR